MNTLIAVIYKQKPDAAAQVLNRLHDLEKEYLVDLDDAVIVRRNEKGKLFVQHSLNLATIGVVEGGFLGVLIGLVLAIFAGTLGLVLGEAAGAALGALSGYLSDYGIDDDFVRTLSTEVEPCCSALFVLARSATPDNLIAELKGTGGHLIKTSLPADVEKRLQRALQSGKPAALQPA